MAVDVLSDRVLSSPQLEIIPFTATGVLGSAVLQDLTFNTRSYLINSGAVGMKFAVRGGLLANFNLRFAIGGQGLADSVTPLVGIEYAF